MFLEMSSNNDYSTENLSSNDSESDRTDSLSGQNQLYHAK